MNDHPQPRRDWFAVERRVFHDEMFAGDEFSRREAWLWLVANAAKRDHAANTRAGLIELSRGEVIIGREFLAKVWKWTPSRVRTFLNQLWAADRLEFRQSDGHHPNVAKIKNYGRFQDFDAAAQPVEPPVDRQQFPEIGSERSKHHQSNSRSDTAGKINTDGLFPNLDAAGSSVKSPVDRQSVASGSPHPYKEQDTKKGSSDAANISKPANRKRASPFTETDRQEAEGAIADYNAAAGELRFSRATVTDQRCVAVAKRLRDLGQGDVATGRERFRQALQAIGHDDFLAGRRKSKDGGTPFRLNLERLLSTGSGMGDVLAKLVDLYDEHGPASAQPETVTRRTASYDDAWREAQAIELAEQRERWAAPEDSGAADAVH